MKSVIASALVALSFAAPAAADVTNAQAFFALGNDSAAERILGETSTGNVYEAQLIGAAANESALEQTVSVEADVATRNASVLSFFALGNDSAAERLVK